MEKLGFKKLCLLNILKVKGRSDLFLKLEIVKKTLIILMIAISILMLSGFAIVFFGEAYLDFVVSDWEDVGSFAKVVISIIKYIAVILLFIIAISTLYNVALIERKKWKIILI